MTRDGILAVNNRAARVEETRAGVPLPHEIQLLSLYWKRLLLRFVWTMPQGLVSSVLRHFYIKVAC